MYEDLEAIAGLKFGEVVERISREGQANLSSQIASLAGRGLANSGPMVSAKLNSALETSERTCRALYEIWLQLILQRNQGRITRDDIKFIMAKVGPCTQARAGQIAQVLGTSQGTAPTWAVEQARTRMQSVESVIGRELEIKFREQEAFPKQAPPLDTGFMAFLRAFGGSWLTSMSGPLTVPLAVAALFVPGVYKLLFAALAVICGVFSSYRVWRSERQRMDGPRP